MLLNTVLAVVPIGAVAYYGLYRPHMMRARENIAHLEWMQKHEYKWPKTPTEEALIASELAEQYAYLNHPNPLLRLVKAPRVLDWSELPMDDDYVKFVEQHQ